MIKYKYILYLFINLNLMGICFNDNKKNKLSKTSSINDDSNEFSSLDEKSE